MFKRLQTWIWRRLTHWLETEAGPAAMQPSDFERLRLEVKPGKHLDNSPYFESIDHPLFAFEELAIYCSLPWDGIPRGCSVKTRDGMPILLPMGASSRRLQRSRPMRTTHSSRPTCSTRWRPGPPLPDD